MGYVRIIPAFLLFWAVCVHYFARVAINIAILSMVPSGGSHEQELCWNKSSSEIVVSEETGRDVFCWTPHQQSLVKGTFYYGYIWFQLPGGRLSEIYGTRRVLGFATITISLMAFISPWATVNGVWYLIMCRVLTGLFSGVIFPSMNPLLVRWVSIDEHGRFLAASCMGGTLGMTVIYPLSSYLVHSFGWQSVFYAAGASCLVWCLFWFLLVTDYPEQHPFITQEELKIIQTNRIIPERTDSLKIPIWEILTSRAFWGVTIPALANDFGIYLLLSEGPNFLLNVLKKDIKQIGFLSTFPYLGRFTGAQLSSALNDYLIKRPQLISKPNVRRLNYGIALLSPALGLVIMGFLTGEWALCLVVQTIAYSLNGFIIPASLNLIDIAPSFSGTCGGLIDGMAAVTGFVVPFVASAFVSSDLSSPSNWQHLFLSSTAFYCFAYLMHLALAKYEPEPFNLDEEKKEGEELEEMKA